MGFKILNFNIFGDFQKNEYFLWYEGIADIFWVITQFDYIQDSFLCSFWSFLKVKVQNGGYFWGLLKFQIFFGVLEIPDIFFLGGRGVNGRC